MSEEALENALATQKERGGRIGEILISQKLVSEEEVCQALSRQLNIPYWAEIGEEGLDLEILRAVPINFCKRHALLPLKSDGEVIQVAVSDPLNLAPMDDLQLLLKQPVQAVLARPSSVVHAINRSYDLISETTEKMVEGLHEEELDLLTTELEEPKDLLDAADEAPIIRLVNSILFRLVRIVAAPDRLLARMGIGNTFFAVLEKQSESH